MFRSRLLSVLTLDVRSLALMRIAYGVLIFADILNRCWHFEMHYAQEGALGLETVLRTGSSPADFSFYMLNRTSLFAGFLMGLNALAGLSLAIGFRTRTSTIACWILANSLQDRNFAILNGGDNWLRLILLWAIFLPWGERWSVDSLRAKPPLPGRTPDTVTSVACLAYLVQEFAVYFISAIHKTGPEWRVDGTAGYLALQLNEWGGAWDWYLLYFPELLKWASFALFAFEVIGPLLLFTPFWRGPILTGVALGFMAFHLGLICLMTLGMFPFVGIASALGLLPSWAWERFPLKALAARLDQLRFQRSVWLDQAHALKRWARRPRRLLPHTFWSKAVAVGIAIGLVWNMGNLKWISRPIWFHHLGALLTLDQNWALFAPGPPANTGWMVVQGVLEGGGTVDLITDQIPASLERPAVPPDKYRTQREKRWYVVLGNPNHGHLHEQFCLYQFRRWAQEYPDRPRLTGINLLWMHQTTTPDFEDRPVSYSVVYKRNNPYR